jgi:hypothetical protein
MAASPKLADFEVAGAIAHGVFAIMFLSQWKIQAMDLE